MFDQALAFVLAREGGFVDDPRDPGGRTNFGITQATYNRWRSVNGYNPADVADIKQAEVQTIYRLNYWNASKAYLLPMPLALVHFDAAVNQGVGQAVKFLQRVVEVKDDGQFGPVTEGAVKTAVDAGRVRELAHQYLWQRLAHYRIISQRNTVLLAFLPGWIRRLEHLWAEVA